MRGRLGLVSTREEELVDLGEQMVEGDAVALAVTSEPADVSLRMSRPTVVQAAAVAVTTLAAGAVTAVVVHRNRARRPALPQARRNGPANGLMIQSTQSFLVNVHVLAPRDR